MQIRGKLLILLLVIAVTPLLFVTFYGFATVRNMGNTLAEQIGDGLQQRMKSQLQLMVQYNVRMLAQKQELVEAWLQVLADSVEDALRKKDIFSGSSYLAEDFDAGRVSAVRIQASTRHFEKTQTGRLKPLEISTEAQVIKLAPDVEPDEVGDSILRMSALTPTYKSGYDRHPDLFYWIYTSLENGVHSSFPGHGGYPEDYDGRNRSWYKKAVAVGDTVWNSLVIDATTKQAIATASRPVFYPDGRLAGVTAIDVPVQALLNQVRLRVKASENSSVFIARAEPSLEQSSLQLLASLDVEPTDWRQVPESRLLAIDHPVFESLVNDIAAGTSGVKRFPYEGEETVWAYGIFQNDFEKRAVALVIVFPFADVVEQVQKAKDYVISQTLGLISVVGVFVIVLTGLVIAAAWGSSRSITEPVTDLARAAQKLAQGDFQIRVPVRSKDEIGQLSSVFNDIAPKLLDRMKVRESLAHLRRYFSPNLAKQLTENPELLGVGGERREMSFVFTDLAGFTGLVEASRPDQIIPVLNEYLDGMTRIVWQREGTIDKVVGDAVHAMFGAPLDQPDHALRAVLCAFDMDRYSESFRAKMKERGTEVGITRIGVNTGIATVGNFGSELMFDYTAHGDAVNTAARLEGANKYFGTHIAVSEYTADLVDNFFGRPIGKLVLKGRSSGLKTFEPLSEAEYHSPNVQAYLEAYDSMANKDPVAEEKFRELLEIYPNDSLAQFHLDRLTAGETGDTVILTGK
ncbi:MAG: adenylate/guanylate cyclase domain-containing protein [Arenicellales bacterium]|nr:adenylate/guanylate cyclase domain-containing protein [Arenicellales bacterium]